MKKHSLLTCFFIHENKGLAGELAILIREVGQSSPTELMTFGTHVKKKESKLFEARFKEISADAPKSKKITFDDSFTEMSDWWKIGGYIMSQE
ncbi:RNA helicase [Ranunculus cassubicifolius]